MTKDRDKLQPGLPYMGAFSAMSASIGCLSNIQDTDPPMLPSQEIRYKAFFPFLFDSRVEISSLPLMCVCVRDWCRLLW